jgi:hypothetical protein
MAGRGRPKAELLLAEDERATLERWARRRTSAQVLALRCRVVLACAEGKANQGGRPAGGRAPGHGGQAAGALRGPAPRRAT